MARGITVYRQEDVVRVPPDSWQVAASAVDLYDQPLGSESAIREFWSGPAIELDLPLLAGVYEYGFYHGIRWSGGQLPAVAAEVDRLDAYWSAAGLTAETLAHLRKRARFVREAVAVATACGGWLVIT